MKNTQTRVQKAGWAILLIISILMVLNGVTWFFSGPEVNVSSTASRTATSPEEFGVLYPEAVKHLSRNARQMAVWFAAAGWMASIAAREGLRRGSRLAWNVTWGVPAVLIAIGLIYTLGVGGLGFANLGFGTLGIVAFVGQLLARPRQQEMSTAERAGASPQPDTSSMMG